MARSSDPNILLLQAAADPTRLRMLRQLSVAGEVCACDFTADASISQPTVSHHLRVLREAGWVTTQRRGTWIWYSLRPEAVTRFRSLASFIADEAAPQLARPISSRRLPVVNATQAERPLG
jgi:ArsR family transcriptional regulator